MMKKLFGSPFESTLDNTFTFMHLNLNLVPDLFAKGVSNRACLSHCPNVNINVILLAIHVADEFKTQIKDSLSPWCLELAPNKTAWFITSSTHCILRGVKMTGDDTSLETIYIRK